MDLEKRISIDPEIQHGKPCIRGSRIPVYIILEMLEHGLTIHEILEEYHKELFAKYPHKIYEDRIADADPMNIP